jgi:hypothetical protein
MYGHQRLCLLVAACLAACVGCATHADRLRDIRQDFFAGNLQQAAVNIDAQLARPGPDANVLKLDRAMVELAAGRPREAERLLREVRDRFDHLEQSDAAEAAGAVLTDDNAQAYAGEDYEKILIRAMLALANLIREDSHSGDARVGQLDARRR